MLDLIRILLVFAIILLLLRKKINIGVVMFIAAAVLILLYQMPFTSIWNTCKRTAVNDVTVMLLLALSFIRILEMILRENAVLTGMMNSFKALFRNRKIVTVSMPLLIGLMPSVGGAYFSAPMVAESTSDTAVSPEEKSFVNYWFRHPWEFILPLYPGILLASAISGVELYHFITVNLPYAALMILTGFVFSMHGMKGEIQTETRFSKKGLWNFAPIMGVLVLVVAFRVQLHYALIGIVLFLFLFYRYSKSAVFSALKHGFSLNVIVLILGIMFFKETMESSGAVQNLSTFFVDRGIPLLPILFLLPFLTGLLTGITVGFVGSTFPLLVSIAGATSVGALSFAFASGFLGVLLSPVHICLILTKDYFKADLWGIYKIMLLPCLIVLCVALVLFLFAK
jgi:integral membrane protein (TIGR00529 family)